MHYNLRLLRDSLPLGAARSGAGNALLSLGDMRAGGSNKGRTEYIVMTTKAACTGAPALCLTCMLRCMEGQTGRTEAGGGLIRVTGCGALLLAQHSVAQASQEGYGNPNPTLEAQVQGAQRDAVVSSGLPALRRCTCSSSSATRDVCPASDVTRLYTSTRSPTPLRIPGSG